jgi:thioredoxin reductase
VLALESRAYGGQAGASARIENYLGFPTGISGAALTGRAYVQAERFGVEIAIPAPAGRLLTDGATPRVELCGSLTRLQARTVVLSCGARYRKLALDNRKCQRIPVFASCARSANVRYIDDSAGSRRWESSWFSTARCATTGTATISGLI